MASRPGYAGRRVEIPVTNDVHPALLTRAAHQTQLESRFEVTIKKTIGRCVGNIDQRKVYLDSESSRVTRLFNHVRPFEWNRLATTLRWPCIGFFHHYDPSSPVQSRTRPRRVKAQQRVGRRKALVKNHQGAKNITLGVKTMRATRRPLLFND
jgi:hypothetical protein